MAGVGSWGHLAPSVLRDADGMAEQQHCGPRRFSGALPRGLPQLSPGCLFHAPYGAGKAPRGTAVLAEVP